MKTQYLDKIIDSANVLAINNKILTVTVHNSVEQVGKNIDQNNRLIKVVMEVYATIMKKKERSEAEERWSEEIQEIFKID